MSKNTNIDKNKNQDSQNPIDKIYTGKSRLHNGAGSVAFILLISVVIITTAAISVGHLVPLNDYNKKEQTETLLENDWQIDGRSHFAEREARTRVFEEMKESDKLPDETSSKTIAAEEITEPTTIVTTTAAPTTTKQTTTAAPTTAKPTTAPTTVAPTTAAPTTAAPTTAAPTTAAPTTTAAPARPVYSQEIQALLTAVNNHRQSKGLASLSLASGAAAEAAAIRAQESSVKFDHERPDGSSPFDLLNQMGVSYMAAGENLAMMPASYTAERVLEAWLNSDGHRANIESPSFKSMAIGIYEVNGYRYWVQLFLG